MTTEQVKNTENITADMIKKNMKIYSKESKLAFAKNIVGCRAMFEETYPDPVRVISMGIPVDSLEMDPLGTGGLNTSVEFCGGT